MVTSRRILKLQWGKTRWISYFFRISLIFSKFQNAFDLFCGHSSHRYSHSYFQLHHRPQPLALTAPSMRGRGLECSMKSKAVRGALAGTSCLMFYLEKRQTGQYRKSACIAYSKVSHGDIWKIYLQANNPNGDMREIVYTGSRAWAGSRVNFVRKKRGKRAGMVKGSWGHECSSAGHHGGFRKRKAL